jgi:exosome complex exonuclease RRP6
MSHTGGPDSEDYGAILPSVMQVIRAASSLAAQDVNFYSSIDSGLAEDINGSGEQLLSLCNKLIQNGDPDNETVIPFGKDKISSQLSWKPVSNVLDSMFEKIDIAFDALNNGKKALLNGYTYLEDSNDSSKGTLKRISKPQSQFKVKIDNSESHPFKPKITEKPNALKSFEKSTELVTPSPGNVGDDEIPIVDPPYYPQPYEYEIDTQPYPESILFISEPIPFKDWQSTSATFVDTKEALDSMIEELRDSKEIAVDLEHHDYRTYYGLVCLMQISNREKDWIIDTLVLRDDLQELNIVFTDPNIVKVFHGAFMDIIWLQRDLGLYIVSLFDTFHASKKLGFPKFSLAYLLETFAKFKTSKKYQLSDWRIRPLPPAMEAYARSDTHFLLNIYDQLKNKLIEADNNKLQEVLYDSRQVAKRRFEYTKYRPVVALANVSCPIMASNPKEPYGSIMAQYNVPFVRKPVVEALYNWRDAMGRKEDESVRFIMPNQLLVNLASLNQPVDAQNILNVSNYVTDHVRSNAKEIAELLENTLSDMEQNDWKLVDQWNDQRDGETDINNLNETTIAAYNNHFEQLLQQDSELLNSTTQDLINNDSILFNDILNKDNITIEFDVESGKVIKHDFNDELESRFNTTMENMHEFTETLKIEVDAVPEIKQSTPQEQEIPKKTSTPIVSAEDKLDPNEIITLRKRNPKQNQNKPSKPDDEPRDAVDYANADKILLDVKKNFNQDKKKRSFDPYGKQLEGPKAAKRQKRMNSGKTTTFTNKKR